MRVILDTPGSTMAPPIMLSRGRSISPSDKTLRGAQADPSGGPLVRGLIWTQALSHVMGCERILVGVISHRSPHTRIADALLAQPRQCGAS
jgi:hypothetical protein